MLQEGVNAQHLGQNKLYSNLNKVTCEPKPQKKPKPSLGVVRLDDSRCYLGAAPDGEGDLALLSVVHGQALEHEAAQAGASSSAAGLGI